MTPVGAAIGQIGLGILDDVEQEVDGEVNNGKYFVLLYYHFSLVWSRKGEYCTTND